MKGFLTALKVSFKLGPAMSVERLFALCDLIISSLQEDSNTIISNMRVFQGEIGSILDPDDSKTQPKTRRKFGSKSPPPPSLKSIFYINIFPSAHHVINQFKTLRLLSDTVLRLSDPREHGLFLLTRHDLQIYLSHKVRK